VEYLTGMTEAAAKEFMADMGEKPYRGGQAVAAVWKNFVQSIEDITTFPVALRTSLKDKVGISPFTVSTERHSKDGTVKLLLSCPDKARIETVYIPAKDERRTVCVSSQTGCPFRCLFCATGKIGKGRNLTTAEMAGQVWEMRRRIGPVTNVVFMGMGEPLLNVDNVVEAFRVLNDPACAGIGRRRITISTIGFPTGLEKLKQTGEAVRIAVSMHSAIAETRKVLVPEVKASPAEIVEAAFDYAAQSKQRLSFECVLIAGLNDDARHAKALAKLLRGRETRVNLIPYNPVEGLDYERPEREQVERFRRELEANGVAVTVRVEFGTDIEAACGQLRAKEMPGR